MAKAQNTFIKSKMNKDLDDRLLSKGEYRDAQNINVSKSEGADVGALENVLGNLKLNSFTSSNGSTVDGAVIIGNLMDSANDRIYVYITNYTDSSSGSLSNPAPAGAYCAIHVYDLILGQSRVLVNGNFLNFSTTNLINGVNLIEELLFWTDNRNQPRKINVNLANSSGLSTPTHYTTEEQISLAKYYPYKTAQLHSSIKLYNATSVEVASSYHSNEYHTTLPDGSVTNNAIIPAGGTVFEVPATGVNNVVPGMKITGFGGPGISYITSVVVNNVVPATKTITVFNSSINPIIIGAQVEIPINTTLITSFDCDVPIKYQSLKPGNFLVIDPDAAATSQTQNIRIKALSTTNPFYFEIESTVKSDLVFSGKDIKLYYPTSYTKSERFKEASLVGQITSGTPFYRNPTDNFPGRQSTNYAFTCVCNGKPRKGMLISSAVGGGNSSGVNQGPLNSDVKVASVVVNTSRPNLYDIVVGSTIPGWFAGFNAKVLIMSSAITFSEENPEFESDWPGDSDFLKEKFVRFAYRFKYEDGEYSLMSPFTQPAFIPKQDGYLTSSTDNNTVFNKQDTPIVPIQSFSSYPSAASPSAAYAQPPQSRKADHRYDTIAFSVIKSQEDAISNSTVVAFFENRVDEVEINIESEFIINQLYDKLKVIEIDILYKESDGLQVKVLDTFSYIDVEISGNSSKIFKYNYQSRKPFRNLTEADTVRVYDKIPIRAKTQSVTGNRVVFGNFIDKPTPPLTLDYYVGINEKFRLDQDFSNKSSQAAYITHSVKQNRNYQVGVVLQDKYGRSSDVILSAINEGTVVFPNGSINSSDVFSGSTIFSKYRDRSTNINNWFGDSIKMFWNNAIPETVSYAGGYPGLYRSGFINCASTPAPTQQTLANILQVSDADWSNDIIIGSIVKGVDQDTTPTPFSLAIISVDYSNKRITLNKSIQFSTLSSTIDIEIIGNSNPLGWYSYKVVVKQEAEDYYNAYLPNSLSGTTEYSIPLAKLQSHITLTGDNINKIPISTEDVAPEQTQFSTSDSVLYPRVSAQQWLPLSQQFNTRKNTLDYFTVDAIGKVNDLGINREGKVSFDDSANRVLDASVLIAPGIYQAKSNPNVARLSTYGNVYGAYYNNIVFSNAIYSRDNDDDASMGPKGMGLPAWTGGSLNPNMAVSIAEISSNDRIILKSPVDGSLYPNPETKWRNKNAIGFVGEITIGNGNEAQWGAYSPPPPVVATQLNAQAFQGGKDPGIAFTSGYKSSSVANSNYKVPFREFTDEGTNPYLVIDYPTLQVANVVTSATPLHEKNTFTRTLTQSSGTPATGSNEFEYINSGGGNGTGAILSFTVTGLYFRDQLTGTTQEYGSLVQDYTPAVETNSYWDNKLERSMREPNLVIKVVSGGISGYEVGDIIKISPGVVTGLSLNPHHDAGADNTISIELKPFNFGSSGGIPTSTNGGGSGLRLRGLNIGPWNTSGMQQKVDSSDVTGSPRKMFWQVTTLGFGYSAGDKVYIDSYGNDLTNGAIGCYWSDPLEFTLLPEHIAQDNPVWPDPLSVMEVKPRNSNLDIYWESSTSGLISELNTAITTAAAAASPFELVFIKGTGQEKGANIFYNENDALNTILTTISCKNINGVLLAGADISLTKVENLAVSDISNEFSGSLVSPLPANVNQLRITNTVNRYFRNNSSLNGFKFYINVSNIEADISYSKDFVVSGFLGNITPKLMKSNIVNNVQNPIPATDITLSSSGGFVQVALYAINGAVLGVQDQGLRWVKQSFQPAGGAWSFVNGNSGSISNFPLPTTNSFPIPCNVQILRFTGGTNGSFTIPVYVNDASGSGKSSTSINITVVVTLPDEENSQSS